MSNQLSCVCFLDGLVLQVFIIATLLTVFLIIKLILDGIKFVCSDWCVCENRKLPSPQRVQDLELPSYSSLSINKDSHLSKV